MTDCGDCPGLQVPRILGMLEGLGREVDAINLGTHMKMAYEHGNCPIDPDEVKPKLENKFSKPVILGTHTYM